MLDSRMTAASLLSRLYLTQGAAVGASNASTFLDWVFLGGSVVVLAMLVVSWLASYRTPKTAVAGPGRWFRLPVWAQIAGGLAELVLLAYLGYVLWIPLPIPGLDRVLGVSRGPGLVLHLLGALLVVWSRWTLGAMYAVSSASAVQLNAQHRLVQHGPYAYVRHPLYVGAWAALLGTLLAYATWAPLAYLMVFLSLHRRARREEAVLSAAFGEEWRAYAARVPMYVPRWRRQPPEASLRTLVTPRTIELIPPQEKLSD